MSLFTEGPANDGVSFFCSFLFFSKWATGEFAVYSSHRQTFEQQVSLYLFLIQLQMSTSFSASMSPVFSRKMTKGRFYNRSSAQVFSSRWETCPNLIMSVSMGTCTAGNIYRVRSCRNYRLGITWNLELDAYRAHWWWRNARPFLGVSACKDARKGGSWHRDTSSRCSSFLAVRFRLSRRSELSICVKPELLLDCGNNAQFHRKLKGRPQGKRRQRPTA